MRAALQPRLHLLVCTNAREGSPLGPGCGARGDAVYDALKQAVAAAGATGSAWVTRTHCLGICPKRGATVARYPAPAEGPIVTEVEPRDAAALLSAPAPVTLEDVARELDTLEALQKQKVLDLARRLRPGLTFEDVQNPHDFPELDDADWHYADGVLAGIASAKSMLAALAQRSPDRT